MTFVGWIEFMRAVWRTTARMRGSHFLGSSPLRLMSFLARRKRRQRRRMAELGTPIPSYCMLSVTGRCNLACVGCYASSFGASGDMPPEVVRRVLAEAEDLGIHYMIIVGGEPLVVPGLIETIRDFRNTIFFLYTNATLLDETHVAAISRAPNILPVVSLEGEATHTDGRRGSGVFARAEAAMGLMRKARVVFGFCTMVTHQNVELVTSRSWLDRMWGRGAVLGVLSDYTPYPGEGIDSLVLTAEDRAMKKRLVDLRKREARPYVVNFPADEYRYGTCGSAGRGFIHISPDGHVEPCPLVRYAADNVKRTGLGQSLASPFFTELRRRTETWTHDGEGCLLLAHEEELAAIAAETGAASTVAPRT